MALITSLSRHKFSEVATDPRTLRTFLLERQPYRFRDRDDTIVHEASRGDSFTGLAVRHYQDLSDRPSGLWWVIADFQPAPIVDPTIAIRPGSLIYIPDPVAVITEILSAETRVFQ